MRPPKTRREFLKAAAATASTLAVSTPGDAKPTIDTRAGGKGGVAPITSPVGFRWTPGGPGKEIVVLDKPHVVTPDSPYLNSSREIANKRFLLDPTRIGPTGFPTGTLGTPRGASSPLSAFGLLTIPPGSKDIRIVDCEFEGPWRSTAEIPDLRPGGPRYLRGIDMYYASGIRIEGCSFDRIPGEAINFHACLGVEIEDVWSTNCSYLVRAQWMGTHRNQYIRLNRLHHADGWNAADLNVYPEYESIYEKGRAIGSNAVNGHFADAEISNLTTSGEVKAAIKLVTPVRVKVDRIYSSQFMIQGTFYWNMSDRPSKGHGKLGAYNHPEFDERLGDHAIDVEITRSRFRPSQNAWLHEGNRSTVQLSYHQEKIRFRDCVFYEPGRAPERHQTVQIWDGAEVDIRDCLFVGSERPDDPLPPFPKQRIVRVGTYGKPGSLPASINADFSRVNRFHP